LKRSVRVGLRLILTTPAIIKDAPNKLAMVLKKWMMIPMFAQPQE
jgi:hypothetical protein